MKQLPLTFCVVAGLLISTSVVQARSLTITTHSGQGEVTQTSDIWIANDTGGVTIAAADLGTDGTPEIIIGNGFGNEPRVRYLRQDGSEILSFLAYAPDYGRGITVAACDLDGDGPAEVVTGTQYGGGAHIRIFDNYGNLKYGNGFFAYDESFRGGANIACGDIDNDGISEIITAAGPTGGPHVRIWEYRNSDWQLDQEFFAYDANDNQGVEIRIVNENGMNKLVTNHMTGGNADEIYFNVSDTISEYKRVDSYLKPTTNTIQIDLDGNGENETISAPKGHLEGPGPDKHIIVDISDQRLYAYENNLLSNSFFISSGTTWFPTPQGNHVVLAKKPIVDYTWNYGEGNPENYSMGNTPWNLMFKTHYYIHSAPWHNNFGNPMSHGCVNASVPDAEWIYEFSELNTPVDIIE